MPEGDASTFNYNEELGLLIHEQVGCWHNWKFAVIFEDIMY